jgi:NAD(P)-dependent dehydrogenase (short-subunit alcohol dehydrogenase family)
LQDRVAVVTGAARGFTRVLAKELGEDGIPVNAVMPGMVATPCTLEHSQEEAFNRVMNNQARITAAPGRADRVPGQ